MNELYLALKPGDKVQVTLDGRWHDCIVLSSKPWRHGVEWRYSLDPVPQTDPVTGISPGTGGYADERFFRSRPC